MVLYFYQYFLSTYEKIQPLLDSDTIKELSERRSIIPEYPELSTNDPSKATVTDAVFHWRDQADTLITDHRGPTNKLNEYLTRRFLSIWPYYKKQQTDTSVSILSLSQAQDLLGEPARLQQTSPANILQICQDFEAIAVPIAFDEKYQPLRGKLSTSEQRTIWKKFHSTADRALAEKNLDKRDIMEILRMHRDLTDRNISVMSEYSGDDLTFIFTGSKQEGNALLILDTQSPLAKLRDRLDGNNWEKIAGCHERVAHKLLEPEQTDILKRFTPRNLYELAAIHESILKSLIENDDPGHKFPDWTPGEWLELCGYHPLCFSRIYGLMQQNTEIYQEAVKKEQLLVFKSNRELWEQILLTVSIEDKQWLIGQEPSYTMPMAICELSSPGSYRADFYPFNHPLYGGMPKTGCCSGFVLDFIRFFQKGNDPCSYARKDLYVWNKPFSALPNRIRDLQTLQTTRREDFHFIKIEFDPNDNKLRLIDILLSPLLHQQRPVVYSRSRNHANVLVMKKQDFYYFDPNHGIWRWRNFRPQQHLDQLITTVADTLFKTGRGCLDFEYSTTLPPLDVLPRKRKHDVVPRDSGKPVSGSSDESASVRVENIG